MKIITTRQTEEGIFYAYGATPAYNSLRLDRFREFLSLTKTESLAEIFANQPKLVF
jgi:hypothetical protein